MPQIELFAIEPELLDGFIYKPDFISREQEQSLVRAIKEVEFADVKRDAAETAALTPGLSYSATWRVNAKIQIHAAVPLLGGIRRGTCVSTSRVLLAW